MDNKLKGLITSFILLSVVACDQTTPSQQTTKANTIAFVFTCTLEKDHNPPLGSEAEKYFQEARKLEKTPGIVAYKLL